MNERFFAREDVSVKAAVKFIRSCAEAGTKPRALHIRKHGETVLRFCLAPYDFGDAMYLYSLSKSFASVAFGIACDDGLISPLTKIADLFPDKLPEDPDERIFKMTMADILTMRTGHPRCVITDMRWADDAMKAFFAVPHEFDPGERFVYSTGATCAVAAAVERVTGKRFNEFCAERLFSKLDIKIPEWRDCHDGTSLGGTGLLLDVDSVSKFAEMLLQGGVYGGRRIVSREYLSVAASRINGSYPEHSSKDWSSGYGYQFWQNGRGGYRGDGAYGQIMFVLPDEDMTAVLFAESVDIVTEFRLFNELLDGLFKKEAPLAEDASALCAHLYDPAPSAGFEGGMGFGVGDNPIGVKTLKIEGGKTLKITVGSDIGERTVECGFGEYIRNETTLRCFDITQVPYGVPERGREMPFKVHASCTVEDGAVTARFRHIDTCHSQDWIIDPKNKKWSVRPSCGDLMVKEFKLI